MTSATSTTPSVLPSLPAGDCLLKLVGAARFLGVSVWTARRWVAQGLLEAPIRINSKPYYRLSTLQAFIAAQRPDRPAPAKADLDRPAPAA
jgi:hypothetical protein